MSRSMIKPRGMSRKRIFQILGPVLFILIQFIPFKDLSIEGRAVLASTAWVALWWITEAVELEFTSLMPIILLPLSGGLPIKETTSAYGHPFIFLFMGGFIIGLAIEKWQLHRRIAFGIIRFVGSGEKRIILGFMLATAFLSMWISNTATAVMMLPIGVSVVNIYQNREQFALNLMLGIGYSASIGGMATLIGTPPNIIFAGVVKDSLNEEISFLRWMLFALPFVVVLLFICWFYLTRNLQKGKSGMEIPDKPGSITIPEKRVLVVFVLIAFFWMTRSLIWNSFIPQLNDTIIAMAGALVLFLIPSGTGEGNLMNWNTAKKLPWGILLIFGGGLAIARGFAQTDLATWLANRFLLLQEAPFWLILILVIAGINFLTEITSNTATASMILPILISLAAILDVPPYVLMAGAVLASSAAFMLPVATPPNAIVFGSGKIKIQDMVRKGVWLNLISILIIFLFVQWWWPLINS